MNKFFLGIFLMLFLVACSSDNNENETEDVFSYPTTLKLMQYEILENVRVFTKSGEIKDENVIKCFITNGGKEPNLFESKGRSLSIESESLINYKTKDSVEFDWGYLKQKLSVKEVGKEIYFYPKDTLVYYDINQGVLDDFVFKMGNYKPYYKTVTIPGTFPTVVASLYAAVVATGNLNALTFNTMSYKTIRSKNMQIYEQSQRFVLNNGFDKNVLALLNAGDTIAVQNTRMVFEKIKN
jgi:hypothetical protein